MLNFDGGFSIGSEKEPQIGGPWIPLTPHKPAAVRSHLIQLGEHPNGYSQEQPRHDGNAGHFASVGLMDLNEETYDLGMGGLPRKKEVINHIAGSYANAFINKAPEFGGVQFTDLLMSGPEQLNSGVQPNGTRLPDRYPLPNLNLGCSKDSDCSVSDPIGLLLESQSNRNLWSNNSHQTPQCGFPVPYGPSYNTNTLTTEFNASSSVTNSFQLAPVTPDQTRRFEEKHLSNVSDFSIESFGHEKDKQEHLVPFARSESVGHHSDELLQNIVDSSSATAISVSFREKIDVEKGRDQDFDLNKTPQLKAPKKRKHRPKVIREGKPKRTPKSAIPEKTNPTDSRPGKRKYVRKNGTKASATKLEDVTKEKTDPFIRYAAKTCRRVLNFDTEKTGDDSQAKIVGQNEEMQNINNRVFNLNSGIQAHKSCTGTSSISTADHSHQNRLIVETLQPEASYNHSHSVNQKPSQHMSQPERIHPETPQSTMADLQLKTSAVPRCAISGNAQTCHRNNGSAYSSTQQYIHAGVSQIVFQTQNIQGNLERTRQLLLNSSRRSGVNDSTNGSQRRGSKREYCHTTEAAHPPTINLVNSSLLCQEIFQIDKRSNNGFNIETGSRETNKKTRIENGFSKERSFTPCITTGDSAKHVIRYDQKDVNENYSPTQINRGNLTPSQESNKAPNNLNDGINKIVSDWYLRFMAAECQMQRQQNSSELHPYKVKADSGIPNGSTHFYNHLATTTECKMLPSTLPRTTTGPNYRQILDNCHVSQLAERQTVEATSSYPVSSNKDRLLQCTDSLDYHQQSSIKASDPRQKQKYPVLVDEILSRLEELNLNNKNNKIVRKEQNALVPYKSDSKIVPFEGLDHLKKHKSRPKVDLDPETNRIWKLLMEEGSNGTEGINKDTEKYWEEEREVFRGRADSFIARMHLVQGDRRFSQWKGSVVDSVIGVFLTQNVSDHLSSSAFMSLVAQFPFQPTSNNTTSYKNESNMKAEGPELSVLYTNDTNNWSEKVANQQIYHYSSATQEATGRNADGTISRVGENILEAQNLRVEEVILSQDSFDSGIVKVAGGLRSSSGSNSEAEDSASACKPNWMQSSTSEDIQQRNITAMFEEFYYNGNGSPLFFESSMNGQKQLEDMGYCRQRVILDREDNLKIPSVVTYPITSIQNHTQAEIFPSTDYLLHPTGDSGLLEEDFLETWGEESISSWSTTASRRKTADNMNSTNKSGQMEESNDKYSVHQQLKPSGNDQCQLNNNQHDRAWASELQGTTVACPGNPVELDTKRLNSTPRQVPHVPRVAPETSEFEGRPLVNKQTHLKNNVVKPNLKEHDFPSGDTHSTTKTTTSRVKKGKVEGDKKTAYNWESLRKQVQPNCTKTKRSKDTMDSLDYEALRKARVDEISAIIKERGMNNMLAERIKDFLNRLVKDHGNVDLEWLRDAPPDKAKEYLLSIRGLGLKSVECVRLLTLRHLAFPVDTNVGRIAVRLGWVPLQPLPESVQLHLLELYPVLESIQKYLWPRLCKLDQRTLYELHYQMITFGKVFCTKSRPNCNACPMRAECRHFASAFASARLALPGPEEKGIVSPLVPTAANRNPVPINPMSLPSPDKYQNGVSGSAFGKCEPIIEVPATPEPECADISESDIEDAFYEDPDEIPTIKLNIEEFTTNLQTYMQQNNMELQEGDMSKALVALNPAASSIPTPKLKNVSRLRTEHQVYELPDSHPLLIEMDIREPDDPSPYLLAIWTPGETANSIQPPERRCESQESGKLCNEDTCFSCNSTRESNSQTVRGTILIPCRTAMRGSFPLNGTYFQVNEVFADHVSSLNPIDVPRSWIWNLPRRTVYFGTSVSTIFKGLTTEGIQYCFWRGFVCVRGFDQKTRAPRPLMARLHFPASKLAKTKNAKTSDK